MFNGKVILITGGTGSFGKKYTEVLLKKYKPKKIIIFSRDELKQYEMQQEYHNDCMRLSLHECSSFVAKQYFDKNKDSMPMREPVTTET